MTDAASKFQLDKITKFLANNRNTFEFSFLTLLAAGGEQLFQLVTFDCPCDVKIAGQYALCFLIAPAIVLLVLGIILNKETWYYFHGCCWKRYTPIPWSTRCFQLSNVIFKALIIPVVWTFVALLDGRYYACYWTQAPCNTTSSEFKSLRGESMIISWKVFCAFILFALIVICVRRCCCSSKSFIEKQYVDILKTSEELKMEKVFKEAADRIGEQNAQDFLASDGRKVEQAASLFATHYTIKEDTHHSLPLLNQVSIGEGRV